MKVKLRKATMHCKYLGNFLLAHNCLFCDLKTSIPYRPSQGYRLLKLVIDALILSAIEAVIHGSTKCDIILDAAILSYASCDYQLLIVAVGTLYQLHLLQTSKRSLPSAEDA